MPAPSNAHRATVTFHSWLRRSAIRAFLNSANLISASKRSASSIVVPQRAARIVPARNENGPDLSTGAIIETLASSVSDRPGERPENGPYRQRRRRVALVERRYAPAVRPHFVVPMLMYAHYMLKSGRVFKRNFLSEQPFTLHSRESLPGSQGFYQVMR